MTYTDILVINEDIHEGWNIFDFTGQELKYRYYRIYGEERFACVIGELSLYGIEVIDSTATSYSSCPITLTLNGGSPITLSGVVTYSDSSTPVLTSIEPRYGAV